MAAVTALNKAPPQKTLKATKKASAKARETTKAIKSSVSTTPPRPSSKAVPSVTPEASDLPREIVTVAPSVPLDLEDSNCDFDNCFDLEQPNNTVDQADIDEAVRSLIDNSSSTSTDTEADDGSNMSPNRSREGDSVTTISKSTLQCLQNEKIELDKQLGIQLKLNQEAKAEIESLKKALEAISSSEDGTAKSAEDALKISNLTSQLATLQAKYDKYCEDTTEEIEALKKKPVGDATASTALQKLQKKYENVMKELKIAKNAAKFLEDQNKSLKASRSQNRGKDGDNELKNALANSKAALAKEIKAKQALERNLRASQKAFADLKKELDSKPVQTSGDADTEDLEKRVRDLEQELMAEEAFREKAVLRMNDAVKEKDKALKMCEELHKSNEQKRSKLEECYKVLRQKGKAILAEISPQVKQAARAELKEVVFRKVKIVNTKSPDAVENFIGMIYDGIKEERMFEAKTLPNSTQKNPDYLTREEFQRIYQKDLLNYFSTLRSTVQTSCKEAITSKSLFKL